MYLIILKIIALRWIRDNWLCIYTHNNNVYHIWNKKWCTFIQIVLPLLVYMADGSQVKTIFEFAPCFFFNIMPLFLSSISNLMLCHRVSPLWPVLERILPVLCISMPPTALWIITPIHITLHVDFCFYLCNYITFYPAPKHLREIFVSIPINILSPSHFLFI